MNTILGGGASGRTLLILAAIVLAVVVAADLGDPYKILGLDSKATLPEIRRAYKKLAKEW